MSALSLLPYAYYLLLDDKIFLLCLERSLNFTHFSLTFACTRYIQIMIN